MSDAHDPFRIVGSSKWRGGETACCFTSGYKDEDGNGNGNGDGNVVS